MSQTESVKSPCVGVCALDEDDLCIGCQRSGQEISFWGRMDDEQKRQVMIAVTERQKQKFSW
ncbi:hypothetical protein OLMES_3505 [Oleiphilus messinensis]|uniref:Fe-S protein n=1 Tax=Oleiphilus messinensis TaxID=141451 RepID=A0A1Y0IDH2_9GAMM|nr:DUF1289 domain-containing protein [Oleiphilus messinensis]ARU57535.1 hypothetical protein OLMES_3505 [Oleiphilus messinensis]